jgi:hypothetical protein
MAIGLVEIAAVPAAMRPHTHRSWGAHRHHRADFSAREAMRACPDGAAL